MVDLRGVGYILRLFGGGSGETSGSTVEGFGENCEGNDMLRYGFLLIGLLSLAGCATAFPVQEVVFKDTGIEVHGGRMLRNYAATEKISPDGSRERSFDSAVMNIGPQTLVIDN